MATAFQILLTVLIPALPITAGVAIFRIGDKWKMFGTDPSVYNYPRLLAIHRSGPARSDHAPPHAGQPVYRLGPGSLQTK